jgi:hypothetical protein
MIKYPSDYNFRIQFILALHPEVLDYIVKTHSVNMETSTLLQIWSACENYECSLKYGKQYIAAQACTGGSKSMNEQHPSHAPADEHRSLWQALEVHKHYSANKTCPPVVRPPEKDSWKAGPSQMAPKPETKGKPVIRDREKCDNNLVSCFICGGPHYAKDCPPENERQPKALLLVSKTPVIPPLIMKQSQMENTLVHILRPIVTCPPKIKMIVWRDWSLVILIPWRAINITQNM